MIIYKDYVIVREATKKGYSIAKVGDSIDYAYYKQNKRRGRVGKEIAHTITANGSPQLVVVAE